MNAQNSMDCIMAYECMCHMDHFKQTTVEGKGDREEDLSQTLQATNFLN